MSQSTTSTNASEQNPPEDLGIGWKSWSSEKDRWWQGRQWSETYRPAELWPYTHHDVDALDSFLYSVASAEEYKLKQILKENPK